MAKNRLICSVDTKLLSNSQRKRGVRIVGWGGERYLLRKGQKEGEKRRGKVSTLSASTSAGSGVGVGSKQGDAKEGKVGRSK